MKKIILFLLCASSCVPTYGLDFSMYPKESREKFESAQKIALQGLESLKTTENRMNQVTQLSAQIAYDYSWVHTYYNDITRLLSEMSGTHHELYTTTYLNEINKQKERIDTLMTSINRNEMKLKQLICSADNSKKEL